MAGKLAEAGQRGGQVERPSVEKHQADKVGGAGKRATKTTGLANVVTSGTLGTGYKGRR
jgi:hypothetical protein